MGTPDIGAPAGSRPAADSATGTSCSGAATLPAARSALPRRAASLLRAAAAVSFRWTAIVFAAFRRSWAAGQAVVSSARAAAAHAERATAIAVVPAHRAGMCHPRYIGPIVPSGGDCRLMYLSTESAG